MFLAQGDRDFESFASEVYYIKPCEKGYDHRDPSFQLILMQWSNQKLHDKPGASRRFNYNKNKSSTEHSGVKG